MAQKLNKNFWIVIFFSILVGLLYVLPPIFVWKYFSNRNESFVLASFSTYQDELTVYLPKAREVYDGHLLTRDLYFDEQKPTVLNVLPTWFFAVFIYLFSGNINLAYLSAQFFFIAVIFILLFYLGLFLFGNSKPWALFFGLIGVLTPLLFANYRFDFNSPLAAFKDLASLSVKQFIPIARTQIHKMFLARVDDPLLTYPIYISAIFSFIVFWRKPKIVGAVLAGLFAGLLFYTYFHYWIYWMIFLGVTGIYALFFQKKDFIMKYLVLAGVVALVSIPYFINYFAFVHAPGSLDYSLRLGLRLGQESHLDDALVYYISYILLLVGVGATIFKRDKPLAILFCLFLAAAFISWNVQFILGKMAVYWQVSKAISPLVFIIFFYVCYTLIQEIYRSRKVFKNVFKVVFLVLTLALISKKVVNVASIYYKPALDVVALYQFNSNIDNSFGWLNVTKESEPKVVSSSLVTSLYLSTYTSSRPFLATGFISPMPMAVLENRYLTANKLFGVARDILEKRTTENLDDCVSNCPIESWFNIHKTPRFLYVNYFWQNTDRGDNWLPLDYLADLSDRYSKLNPRWSDTDSDYVYYGPWEKQFSETNFDETPELKLVYKNPEVAIYKIK